MGAIDIGIAIVGCGYWGPNLVRTFAESSDATVKVVVDRDLTRLEEVARRHQSIPVLGQDLRDVFRSHVDAVVVCTPPETHYEIVSACLDAGLDVLVEKPLAASTEEARRLVELAERRGRVLMVGHIGAYNSAVAELRDMVQGGALGDIAYIDAVRVGLGLFRPNLNVIWDLAPHDIAILMHLLGEAPTSVTARGVGCVESSIEDVAYLTLAFPGDVLAHCRLSWLDPCKTRRITVVGNRKMVVYDDLEPHEKLKIYDKRVAAIPRTDTFGDFQFAYHYGSVVSPYIEIEEPLRRECAHFLDCVIERSRPLTDGVNGLEVVEVIEAAQQSLGQGGAPVAIGASTGPVRRRRRRADAAPASYTPAGADGRASGNGHGNGQGNGHGIVQVAATLDGSEPVEGEARRVADQAAEGRGATGEPCATKPPKKRHRNAVKRAGRSRGRVDTVELSTANAARALKAALPVSEQRTGGRNATTPPEEQTLVKEV